MYERMLNKNEKPTAEQMASYCGATSTMFTELIEWISNGDSMVQAIVFPYGNNYGCPKGRKQSLHVQKSRMSTDYDTEA